MFTVLVVFRSILNNKALSNISLAAVLDEPVPALIPPPPPQPFLQGLILVGVGDGDADGLFLNLVVIPGFSTRPGIGRNGSVGTVVISSLFSFSISPILPRSFAALALASSGVSPTLGKISFFNASRWFFNCIVGNRIIRYYW